MPDGTASGSVRIYELAKVSKQIRKCASRHVRLFSSRDEFFVLVVISGLQELLRVCMHCTVCYVIC